MKTSFALLALLACAAAARAQGPAQGRVFADGCIEKTPGPVSDLTATANGASEVNVAWNAPKGDACIDTYSYVVYEKGQPEPRTVPSRAQAYSLSLDKLKPETTYIIKVQAVNEMKGTGPGATVEVKTGRKCLPVPPAAIGAVNLNQASSSVLYLSWLPPAAGGCVDGYQLVGTETGTGKRVANINSRDPSTRATGLQPGIEYTFRITPMNNRGEGPTKRVTYTLRRPMASNVVASGSIPAGH